ncbi:Kinesin-like protein kip2 [Tulasnella sp. 408]|nr:Kinesin-like protein kip2 [Tulasnella sp. 408]
MAVDTRPPVARNAPPSTPKRVGNVAATVDFPREVFNTYLITEAGSSLGLRAGPPSQQQPTKIRAVITAGSRICKKSSNLYFSPARVPNGCRSATSNPLSSPSKTATAKILLLFPLADFDPSLLDWTTVKDGDVSMEVDEQQLNPTEEGKPSGRTNERAGVVQLQQEYARAGAPIPNTITVNNILTGSKNKCIYNGAKTLEIYKEQIHDLLSPSSAARPAGGLPLQDISVVLGLREEVVMSVKGLKAVLERGTASTDWDARSSRSRSVFGLVIESQECGCPSIVVNWRRLNEPQAVAGREPKEGGWLAPQRA